MTELLCQVAKIIIFTHLKNGMCFVNGECSQGSICDLCEPPPSTPAPAPSTPTPERTSTTIPPASESNGKIQLKLSVS